jgi:cell division protein FtsB
MPELRGRTVARRLFLAVVIVAGLIFAVQGGEFGTTDLLRQKQRRARLAREVDSLRHVDSLLRIYANKVEHDPATQERIAREVFGMVRGQKELLYRFSEAPDSSVKR